MQWTRREFEESRYSVLTLDRVSSIADCQVGRRVKSKKRARKSYRSRGSTDGQFIAVDVFIPPSNTASLSVDCLRVTSDKEIADIAVRQLENAGMEFYGWYVLRVHDIYENRCKLRLSPTPENKYHADIVFPVDLESDQCEDEIAQIADCLAARAVFEPYGKWTDEVSLGQP